MTTLADLPITPATSLDAVDPTTALSAEELARVERLVHPDLTDPEADEYGRMVAAHARRDGATEAEALDRARASLRRRAARVAGSYCRCFVCGRLLPPAAMIQDPSRDGGVRTRCQQCRDVRVQDLYLWPIPGRLA